MLVHKKTMGVLNYFWDGTYTLSAEGKPTPLMTEHTFDNTPGIDPSEWWCLPNRSDLGRRLLRAYPCCDPVTDDDGNLVGITSWISTSAPEPEHNASVPKVPRRRRRRKKSVFEAIIPAEACKLPRYTGNPNVQTGSITIEPF